MAKQNFVRRASGFEKESMGHIAFNCNAVSENVIYTVERQGSRRDKTWCLVVNNKNGARRFALGFFRCSNCGCIHLTDACYNCEDIETHMPNYNLYH